MKRVCILSHGLSNNGIDIFVRNVVTRLDPEKWDVSVVLALDENGVKQPREDDVLNANIPIYRTSDLRSAKHMLLHAKKLYHILKSHPVDVLHSNMDLLNGLNCLVAWAAGVPVRVSHSHTSASQYETKTGRHLISGVYRFIMKTLCTLFSNGKCGCSKAAMAYLFGSNWAAKRNVQVINNGIDTKRFSRTDAPRNPSMRRIVTVGRLCEAKNPFFAIDVIEELSCIRQDFVYQWVGGGGLETAVSNRIRDKGLEDFIQLLGVRNDIEDILPACDLFLMPSLFEGLGIALIEAQAAGLPCVVSDTVPREADCGGCLFLPLDAPAKEWAMRISDILDGKQTLTVDREKLQKFDITYTISQLEKVYSGN